MRRLTLDTHVVSIDESWHWVHKRSISFVSRGLRNWRLSSNGYRWWFTMVSSTDSFPISTYSALSLSKLVEVQRMVEEATDDAVCDLGLGIIDNETCLRHFIKSFVSWDVHVQVHETCITYPGLCISICTSQVQNYSQYAEVKFMNGFYPCGM